MSMLATLILLAAVEATPPRHPLNGSRVDPRSSPRSGGRAHLGAELLGRRGFQLEIESRA